jgi:hypothetical protein
MIETYLIDIDDKDLGMNLISYIQEPAIVTKGMAFSLIEKRTLLFKDEVKMRIVAPALIPMDIYRFDSEEGEEYNVRFTEENIEKIHQKFMKGLNTNNVFNIDHTTEMAPAYLLEVWLVADPKTDKAKTIYGIDVPKGTLMMTSQVTDRAYYDMLIESGRTAYSIEGVFDLIKLELNKNKNKTETKMDKLMLPDGEHTIGEKIYIVKDGEIIEIKDVVKAEEVKEEETVEQAEVTEEVTEEVTAEEVVEEEVNAELEITEDQILAIVQPKLDEILGMIADIMAKLPEAEVEEETNTEEVAMTVHQKFSAVVDFLRK